MEIFNLVKRYPSEVRYIKSQNTNEEFQLRLLRKLPLYNLNKQATEYVKELQKYTNECIEENKPLDKEQILFILNPLEGKEDIDNATLSRIDNVFEQLSEIIDSSRKDCH